MLQPLFGDSAFFQNNSGADKENNSKKGKTRKRGKKEEKNKGKKKGREEEEEETKRQNKRPRVRPVVEFIGHDVTTRVHSSQFKLDLKVMKQSPEKNFGLWDKSEIAQLESYRDQFCYFFPQNKRDTNFYQNWVNCDKAIHYFYAEIQPKWRSMDLAMPLKEAIRSGNAIELGTTLVGRLGADEAQRILATAKRELGEGQKGLAKQALTEGKQATLTVSEYLDAKQNGTDTELGELLDQYKYDEKILHLVDQRKDPCPPDYYDPRKTECQAECLPEAERAQFLIDKMKEKSSL